MVCDFDAFWFILEYCQYCRLHSMKAGRLVVNKELEFGSDHGVRKVLTQHLPGKQQNSVRIASPWPSP